jgi:hypothetical protein
MASDDFEHLLGQHVPGPDGYRFAAIERGLGNAVRLQIVAADGDEVGWAAGVTTHELLHDAKEKTEAHETRRAT